MMLSDGFENTPRVVFVGLKKGSKHSLEPDELQRGGYVTSVLLQWLVWH